jgi:hypothetical protein
LTFIGETFQQRMASNGQQKERRTTMKLIISTFLLASPELLVNTISELRQLHFTASEVREVTRRLNAIGRL